MPFTETEIAAIARRALKHSSQLDAELVQPNGEPGSLARSLNPDAAGSCRSLHILGNSGSWSAIHAQGDDLVDLVAHVAIIDREEAAIGLRDWLDRQPAENAPELPSWPGFRAVSPPPRQPAPPRSLRRG